MTIRSISLSLFLLLLLASCGSSGGSKSKKIKGKSQSAPYELLVIADKQWLQTESGQSLMELVEGPIQGLPQYETHFRCIKINPAGFNKTFRVYRNIVMAEVSRKYKEPGVRIEKDVYCQPQVVMYLTAPDNESFVQMIKSHGEQILDILNAQEFDRERGLLKKKYSRVVHNQAKKQFGIDFYAPQDIDKVKIGKDFFWASSSKQDFKLNVCMYCLPLRDLSLDDFIVVRDSIMRINIPGDREDQWMETDSRTVTFRQHTSENGKGVRVEVRGLWDMRHDAMGGPFVSYLMADEKHNRLLIAEGFVFAPEEKKRAMIRELEAALQTIVF